MHRLSTTCTALWAVVALLWTIPQTARADDDIYAPQKPVELPEWLKLDASYRVRSLHLDPLELSGTTVRGMTWTEQRMRLDIGFRKPGWVGVYMQADILDGVLFGDNGTIGSDPEPINGVSVAAKRPNVTSFDVGLPDGADPLDPDSYVPVLRGVQPIEINHLYAEVNLPAALLRVGRQALAPGANLAAHDGGRWNRWGISYFSDSADRVLAATKLDAIYTKLVDGMDAEIDTSLERGLFLAVAYDWFNQGLPHVGADDLRQWAFSLRGVKDEADWFGLEWRDLLVSLTMVYLSGRQFNTDIFGLPFRLQGSVGDFSLLLQTMVILGNTREISEGFSELNNTTPVRQKLEAYGMQLVADYKLGPVTLTFEFDLASGDADPRPDTTMSIYSFARDLNVGLLLFEHVLAFETARSAQVGIENLSNLQADSFPITEVDSDGRFSNAIAVFPQVKWDIFQNARNLLHLRFGALFAWPEAGGVVDPVMTLLAEDGEGIGDDAVNYYGGRPGSYYGTELDIQLQWSYRGVFEWVFEGAVLFPGDALQDENGDAVNAFLAENRFVFNF